MISMHAAAPCGCRISAFNCRTSSGSTVTGIDKNHQLHAHTHQSVLKITYNLTIFSMNLKHLSAISPGLLIIELHLLTNADVLLFLFNRVPCFHKVNISLLSSACNQSLNMLERGMELLFQRVQALQVLDTAKLFSILCALRGAKGPSLQRYKGCPTPIHILTHQHTDLLARFPV